MAQKCAVKHMLANGTRPAKIADTLSLSIHTVRKFASAFRAGEDRSSRKGMKRPASFLGNEATRAVVEQHMQETPTAPQRPPEAPRGPRGHQGSQRRPEAFRGTQRPPEAPRGPKRPPEAPRCDSDVYRTANSEQRTANSEQRTVALTVNNEQRRANSDVGSEQRSASSEQRTANNNVDSACVRVRLETLIYMFERSFAS